MPKTETAIGVDLGAHALKAVVLRRRGSHTALVRAVSIELGELAFLDDSERKDARIAEFLRQLVRQARIRRCSVGTGLAGRDYFAKYLHVPPAPPQKLRKLIEYEVSEDPTSGVREQTADFWLLDLPTRAEEFTILLALARNDTLHRRLDLLRHAGLSCDGLTLNAIALYYAYVQAKDEAIYNDKTTLLADIGARHMDVVVQRNAKLLFVRNLTHGGLRFSESLQEEFHLPIAEAEDLKLSQGAILPHHFDVAAEIEAASPEGRLSAALLEPAEAICDTLQATIKYCQSQTRLTDLKIDEIVLSGRGSRLRGLRELLAHRFRMPVEILDPLAKLDASPLPARYRDEVLADAGGYTTAIGLALRQLAEPHARPITLLPEAVRKRREFLARSAFVYAAAAVFILAFAAMIYSSSVASAKAERDLGTEKALAQGGLVEVEKFDSHMKQNALFDSQASALKRLFDTARRSNEALALLKQKVPPQLCVDAVNIVTETPADVPRRGKSDKEPELSTHFLIEGTVAGKFESHEITIAAAQSIVDSFLMSLLDARSLYGRVGDVAGKVTKYPDFKGSEASRSFKIDVYFTAPFYGGGQESGRK